MYRSQDAKINSIVIQLEILLNSPYSALVRIRAKIGVVINATARNAKLLIV